MIIDIIGEQSEGAVATRPSRDSGRNDHGHG